MKHVFIINPKAGKKDITPIIKEKLKEYDGKIDYEIYVTSGPNDALEYTKKYLEVYKEKVRFYACGGDGTLNEVVNGTALYPNASVACYPCGSGNDFVKVYGDKEAFLDLDNLINGEEKIIDLIKVNDRYTINICNLGFDAHVASKFIKFKMKPLVSGHTAYNMAVVISLVSKMKHRVKVLIEDQEIYDGNILLSAVANGICYGGGYYCSPYAKVDDGLLDISIVKTLSRFKFIRMISKYKNGTYLENPEILKYVIYQRAKKVEYVAEKDIVYCMDGEVFKSKHLTLVVDENALKFVVPKKLS